jgi:hypothetical protein
LEVGILRLRARIRKADRCAPLRMTPLRMTPPKMRDLCSAQGGIASAAVVPYATFLSSFIVHANAAIPANHTTNAARTTQSGAAPTRRNKNGRKFQQVMWT